MRSPPPDGLMLDDPSRRVQGLEFQCEAKKVPERAYRTYACATSFCVRPHLPMGPTEAGAKQYDQASLRVDHLDGHRHLTQPRSER
jgi:hypothetical protein